MLDPLPAFILTMTFVTIIGLKYKIIPFFTLVGGAILFGILTGMDLDILFLAIMEGLGRLFGAFGIIILSGTIIASLIVKQNQIELIV